MKVGVCVTVFEKDWVPILGRCVLGEEGCEVPLKGGRGARLVGLFLGGTGVGCLWSSLPKLWKTSSEDKKRRKTNEKYRDICMQGQENKKNTTYCQDRPNIFLKRGKLSTRTMY